MGLNSLYSVKFGASYIINFKLLIKGVIYLNKRDFVMNIHFI